MNYIKISSNDVLRRVRYMDLTLAESSSLINKVVGEPSSILGYDKTSNVLTTVLRYKTIASDGKYQKFYIHYRLE